MEVIELVGYLNKITRDMGHMKPLTTSRIACEWTLSVYDMRLFDSHDSHEPTNWKKAE